MEKSLSLLPIRFFEGCGGLELTEEMILTVAGQACLLIVNRNGRPYPHLRSVILYPKSYTTTVRERGPGGTIIERKVHRLGESWSNGTVILSWNSVQNGAQNINDGHNVTFHEFAHQLDSADGRTDGVPDLDSAAAYHTWGQVMSENFERLVKDARKGRKTVLDHYGATNRAEYFAVATEAFFEKPRQMLKKRPELYHELKEYYHIDPLEWFQPKSAA